MNERETRLFVCRHYLYQVILRWGPCVSPVWMADWGSVYQENSGFAHVLSTKTAVQGVFSQREIYYLVFCDNDYPNIFMVHTDTRTHYSFYELYIARITLYLFFHYLLLSHYTNFVRCSYVDVHCCSTFSSFLFPYEL